NNNKLENNSHNFSNSSFNNQQESNFQGNKESYKFSSANNLLKRQNLNSERLQPLHNSTNVDYQENKNITNIEISDNNVN
ncbi:20971_t:CDS:2, partial [Rhizophagus irregularis]